MEENTMTAANLGDVKGEGDASPSRENRKFHSVDTSNKKCMCKFNSEEHNFCSTSSEEAMAKNSFTSIGTTCTSHHCIPNSSFILHPILLCSNSKNCVTLKQILDSFKSPISEEQAWALIFQFIAFFQNCYINCKEFTDLEFPNSISNLNIHADGSVHCSWTYEDKMVQNQNEELCLDHHLNVEKPGDEENHIRYWTTCKKIIRKVAVIVYTALDYNLEPDEQCPISHELEDLITYMTAEDLQDDCIDEGIDEGFKRWDEDLENEKYYDTNDFEYVLEACSNHVKPMVPDDHYKAVCRALVTETIELRIFLQQVLSDDIKAESVSSNQELAKLGFSDWARFWVQVIDELRRGVRLKKSDYSRTPIEFQLTPYEILMEDIRSRKYQLRKVMINGDVPQRVKKDAHAFILEFIRSRPPLKKASDRTLPPPRQRKPSPREQLMDSIRRGRQLKHIQPPPISILKDQLNPSYSSNYTNILHQHPEQMGSHTTPRSKQRLIKVDFSLLRDDEIVFKDNRTSSSSTANVGVCSLPKMPPYPIEGYINNAVSSASPIVKPVPTPTRFLRRTICDSNSTSNDNRRSSFRRHTIVGCQSNVDGEFDIPSSTSQAQIKEAHITDSKLIPSSQFENNSLKDQCEEVSNSSTSLPPFQESEQNTNLSRPSSIEIGPWNKSFFDEKTWHERGDDRLSLTLDEIVHIRYVMTKAELESLPVGVRIKEDVEKRKVCFLCLRTRFSIFGQWGIQCKLCQRTVCSKCSTKMRIPTENFRNVPLVLISPSLLSSPASSSTPSPCQTGKNIHSSSTENIVDDSFPKTLIERLLRTQSDRKVNCVGSVPPTPKYQIFNPNVLSSSNAVNSKDIAPSKAIEALHEDCTLPSSYASHSQSNSLIYGSYNQPASAIPSQACNKSLNIMSRSMEGPRSLPANSPARTQFSSSTLDRKNRFSRAFTSSGTQLSPDQKENFRGEQVSVCDDCKGLVMEISRSSKQSRSSARNRALANLKLDLSPVYK